MKKQILLGTTNQAKILMIRTALEPLAVNTLTLQDLKITLTVDEDGRSTKENAEKKARAYFDAANIPVLTNDGGLHIEKFPKGQQPGTFVRRIQGATNPVVTEEEIVRHYQSELQKVGGESLATWEGSIALALSNQKVVAHTFSFQTIMTSRRQGIISSGSPLDVLTIEPVSGKYYAEMTWEERKEGIEFQQIFGFVRQYLNEL